MQRLQQRRIDSAINSIGIPVLHFPPADEYDNEEIFATVMEKLRTT